MPVHLFSLDRRDFLRVLGCGALAVSTRDALGGDGGVDVEEDLVSILNDTRIGEKHPADSPVPSHLRQVVEKLTGLKKKPAAVLVNGDLALKDGQPGDYRHFARLLAPLRDAEIDVNLTLGNHDHRGAFYDREARSVMRAAHFATSD